MSKSLGNFITIHDLLKDWPGDVIRLNMLKTHYRQPIDWTMASLENSRAELLQWTDYLAGKFFEHVDFPGAPDPKIIAALTDDLNSPLALAATRALFERAVKENTPEEFGASLKFLGFQNLLKPGLFHPGFVASIYESGPQLGQGSPQHRQILQFRAASANGMIDFATNTQMQLENEGFVVRLNDAGVLFVGNKTGGELEHDTRERIKALIDARDAARKARDYTEADRIRGVLGEMGVALKDAKDPVTGKVVTTWEPSR